MHFLNVLTWATFSYKRRHYKRRTHNSPSLPLAVCWNLQYGLTIALLVAGFQAFQWNSYLWSFRQWNFLLKPFSASFEGKRKIYKSFIERSRVSLWEWSIEVVTLALWKITYGPPLLSLYNNSPHAKFHYLRTVHISQPHCPNAHIFLQKEVAKEFMPFKWP